MLDRERALAKLDELEGYQRKLGAIVPPTYAEYLEKSVKRRGCERLLQVGLQPL